jgi:hypothetical protein
MFLPFKYKIGQNFMTYCLYNFEKSDILFKNLVKKILVNKEYYEVADFFKVDSYTTITIYNNILYNA